MLNLEVPTGLHVLSIAKSSPASTRGWPKGTDPRGGALSEHL